MKFWHGMAYTEIDQLEAVTIKAEELGFHGIALADHLATMKKSTVSWNTDTPWPDVWVQIGSLSKVTSEIRFATSVYILPMRDPFTVAKAVGTAAWFSGGRLRLGIGTGWMEEEFDLVGQAFKQRGRRMDEQIEVMRKLWTGDLVEHHGEFFEFEPLQMSPAPGFDIPIFIGGEASIAKRRAARFDGWWGQAYPFRDIPEIVEGVRRARRAEGRSLDDYEIILTCLDLEPEMIGELEELGVTGLMLNSWLEGYKPTPSLLEYKLGRIERFAEDFF